MTKQIQYAERADSVDAAQRERKEEIAAALRGQPIAAVRGGDGGYTEITDEVRALAFQSWFLSRSSNAKARRLLTDKHRQACALVGFEPHEKELAFASYGTDQIRDLQSRYRSVHPTRRAAAVQDYRAALSPQIGPQGAYLVPPETLSRELEINLLYYGGVREVAETIVTESGERMSWPTVDDTTNKGRRLGPSAQIGTGGSPASTGASDPTFAKVYLDAYKYTSDAVLVPYELLQDSAFQLAKVLGQLLGIRLGRITNTEFTTGTGNSMPKGIVTCATSFSAASHTAIAFDDVLGLIHSVDPAYRQMKCGFMMHDQIVLALRKLKNGIGDYIWQSNQQVGQPDRLEGYEFTVNQDMSSTIAQGNTTLLFGALEHQKIRRVRDIRMYHLEERYRDYDQDAFLCFLREDSNMLTAGTPPVKALVQ